tara:strand:- start:827 stop:2110 length:1284 start_codon:yes stop_codon:yes gene_type:complete
MSKIPSIYLQPTIYKAGKLLSALPTNGAADLTFTRADGAGGGKGSRVNQNGLIEIMDANVPRLDYYNGGCPSLLLEPTSANKLLQSEDYSISWSRPNLTATLSTVVNPRGLASSYKLEATSTNQPRIEQSSTVPASNTIHTFSVYVKRGNSDFVALSRFSGGQFAIFNLAIGTVKSSTSENAKIESFDNGWFRISMTQTVLSADSNNLWKIHSCIETSYSAGVVGNYFYAWGTQLEELATPTSYIPTTTAIATRLQDTASKTGLGSYINSTEGVLYYEFNPNGILGINKFITLNNSTGIYQDGSLQLYQTTGNQIRFRYDVSGVNQADIISPLTYLYGNIKVAALYSENKFQLWVNGFKVGEDLLGSVAALNTFVKLEFSRNNLLHFFGKVKDLRIYNIALTDAELQELTGYTSYTAMANELNYNII